MGTPNQRGIETCASAIFPGQAFPGYLGMKQGILGLAPDGGLGLASSLFLSGYAAQRASRAILFLAPEADEDHSRVNSNKGRFSDTLCLGTQGSCHSGILGIRER